MSQIWRETGFVENDPWVVEADDTPAGAADIIYRFETFLVVAESATESRSARAVLVAPGDDVARLVPHLDRLSLIAVAFPAFSDGRAFSHAALLRTRLGYSGEIRAVGDVLIDQIPLMLRCGIDSFAVDDAVAARRLAAGRLNGIPLHYQPSARPAAGAPGYAWRRMSKPAA